MQLECWKCSLCQRGVCASNAGAGSLSRGVLAGGVKALPYRTAVAQTGLLGCAEPGIHAERRRLTWTRLNLILSCSWGNPSVALPKPELVVKGKGILRSSCDVPC